MLLGTTFASDVSANVTDVAGNTSVGLLLIDSSSDVTAPTVAISASQTSPSNAATLNMTVQFSEPVTGFAIGDITVVNGTKGNFVAVDADTYTFDITPDAGTVTVTADIAGAVAKDAALNDNTAAPQFSIVSDKTAPTVTKLGDDTVDVTIAAAATLNLVFSEPLSAAGKLAVTGAITTGANNGHTYSWAADTTLTITGHASGTIFANDVSANVTDVAGNTSVGLLLIDSSSDVTAPTVAISASQTSPSNAATLNMTVQFSEPVTGFVLGDITVVNGAKGNFVAVDGDTYTFDITPNAGTVTVTADIAGAVAKDIALNDNTAAPQFSIVSDKTAPTVTRLGDDTVDVTIAAAATLNLVFSEPLSAAGKLAVTGAITTGANNGPTYSWAADTTLTITGHASGTTFANDVTANVTDVAGNTSVGLLLIDSTGDTTAPTVAISSSQTSPSNAATLNMTVQFSETVTGFAIGDITVVNGVKGNFVAVDADTYTFDITPSAGTVTVTADIAGAAAKDVALNDNTAAPQFTIISDKTAPTVTKLGDDTVDVSIAAAGTLDLVFSEPLSAAGKLAVTGAITTGANNGPTYSWAADTTLTITGHASGTTFANDVSANVTDVAGNTSVGLLLIDSSSDVTAPTVAISASQTSPSNAATLNMTVQFSEPVTGFAIGDITVVNGTKGNFVAVDADTYTFDITPDAGTVTVSADIAGAAAKDVALNDNTAAHNLA